MPVTTNTRKLAALLGASGAGIGTDGLLQAAAVDANVATQAELDAVSSTVTANATTAKADTTSVRQDISILALREAITEDRVANNLPNSFIDQFQDDSGIGTETNTDRGTGEYVSTVVGNNLYSLDLTDNTGDADTSYLKTGDLSSITGDISTGDWTIDYWLNVYSGATGAADRHFSFGNTANNTAPMFSVGYNAANRINLYHLEGTDNNELSSFAAFDTGVWHHWAFQRDGGTIYAYFDGDFQGSASHSSTADLMNGHDLYIGRRHGYALEHTAGYYYGFRVSNVKRYTNSVDFTRPSEAYTRDANTVLYWTFQDTALNEGAGDTSEVVSSTPTGDCVRSPTQNFNLFTVINATGTMIGNANVPSAAQTKVSGVMLYKDNAGTATIGTDLEIYFTCNGGTNWTEAASYTTVTPVFSTGVKMVKLGETTCTSGSDVRYKAVWANQTSAKETQLHGIGLNY